MKGRRADLLAIALLLAIGILVLWPLAWLGFPLHTDDIKYHAGSAQQFFAEMQAGAFYPRWLAGMNGGLGSPFFFFYGPVSFWLTSLAASLTGVRDGILTVEMVFCATMCASGLSAYAWLRSQGTRPAATIGAALYMVLPYHLTIDLWTRAAFYEFNAFALTPLVFLGIEWLRQGQRRGAVLLPVAFALLVMTHIVTAMLVTLLAGVIILLGRPSLRSLITTGLAFALGLLLAAAYLSTALGLREFTSYQAQDIALQWFLPAGSAGQPMGRMMEMLTVLVVIQAVFAAAMIVWSLRQPDRALRRRALLWSGLTFFTLLCMTRPFEPFWNRLPILHNAQFPFRILAFTDLGIATLVTLAATRLLAIRRPGSIAVPLAVPLVIIALFGILEAWVPISNGSFERSLATWTPEFPAQGDYKWFRPLASVDRLPMDTDPTRRPDVPLVRVVSGEATATLADRVSRRITLSVDAASPAVLDIGQLDFVGWQATIDGKRLPVIPSADLGLVEVTIPPGRYTLVVTLAATPIEQAGLLATGAGALIWLVLLGRAITARRHPVGHQPA